MVATSVQIVSINENEKSNYRTVSEGAGMILTVRAAFCGVQFQQVVRKAL